MRSYLCKYPNMIQAISQWATWGSLDKWKISKAYKESTNSSGNSYLLVPPKFIGSSPNHQHDGIWRCGLWEVDRFTWGHEGGPSSWRDQYAYKKRKRDQSFLPAMLAHGKKMAIYKPRRESSPEFNHACILILDFRPPEPWEINVWWLSHLVCGILF